MAAIWYNQGKFAILSGGTNLSSATMNVLLIKDNYTEDADHVVVTDVVSSEVSGGSYSRQTLASKTFDRNDSGDFAFFNAVQSVFSAVPTQTPQEIEAAIIFDNAGAGDSQRELFTYNDFSGGTIQGNGSDVTVQWNGSSPGTIARLT
jgi:hypothetical protein